MRKFSRSHPILTFVTLTAAIIGSCAGVCTIIQFLRSETPNLPTEPNSPSGEPTPTSQPSLEGAWWIDNTTRETTHDEYVGLNIGYKIFIHMTDSDIFEASGEKWTENGKEVTGRAHTPIRIEGSIDGNTISALLWEQGTQRATTGQFIWKRRSSDDDWIGEFSSTSAHSSGPSVLYRQEGEK